MSTVNLPCLVVHPITTTRTILLFFLRRGVIVSYAIPPSLLFSFREEFIIPALANGPFCLVFPHFQLTFRSFPNTERMTTSPPQLQLGSFAAVHASVDHPILEARLRSTPSNITSHRPSYSRLQSYRSSTIPTLKRRPCIILSSPPPLPSSTSTDFLSIQNPSDWRPYIVLLTHFSDARGYTKYEDLDETQKHFAIPFPLRVPSTISDREISNGPIPHYIIGYPIRSPTALMPWYGSDVPLSDYEMDFLFNECLQRVKTFDEKKINGILRPSSQWLKEAVSRCHIRHADPLAP